MPSSNSTQIDFVRLQSINWMVASVVMIFSILFTSLTAIQAVAQISKLEVGDRVRITAPIVDQKKIMGTVTEVDNSVLVLSVRDSSFYISESLIQRLETSTGRKRVFGRGLLIGAVTGTMLSGMVHSFLNNACGVGEDCVLANRDGEAFIAGAAIGLIVGATVGGTAGFFTKVHQWERVPYGIAINAESVRTDFTHSTISPAISFRFSLNR